MTTDEKDFLGRWSRRKQAAREGLADPEPQAPDLPAEPERTEAVASEEAEAAAEDAYADVDFDALDYASDYTRFMGKDVPEIIQRRALRALWRSDPVLANVDGLNDYDDDFTDAATVVQNLVTAYKTGQGYRTDEEMAALEDEEKAEAEARAQAGQSETGDAGAQDADTPDAEPVGGEAPDTVAEGQADDAGEPRDSPSRS